MQIKQTIVFFKFKIMKARLIITRAIAAWVAIMASFGLQAQDNLYTKVILKEFQVNQNTRLELANQYGNVDIVNCEDQRLSIEVNLKVNVRDKDKANEILNTVKINITQEGDVIKAVTVLDDDFSRMFRGSNNNNGGLEINYTVTMPKTLPVHLTNKYGNVFVDELVSTSTLDVKYGKLTINKILHDSKEPLTKIFLSYSKGTIQEARWIELDIKYSQLNITDSKALALMSKYSKVFVTNGSSIVSESKYDTYEIGKLNNFITTAAYGHFVISELSGKLQVDTKYSDVIVDNISSGFEQIKINNSYGTYKLGIDPDASYKLNGYSKYCTITYPEKNARVNQFNENNELKVNGVVGNNPNPSADVSVTSRYGNIRLIR
jgi:hypothetical protein